MNSERFMQRTVMVGSGNLHQLFFLYFVRFFCGRWFWTACGGSVSSMWWHFWLTVKAKGMISVTKYFDGYFFFRRCVVLAMHKSAFQLLRRIALILIFMADRTNFFLRFVARWLHSLAFWLGRTLWSSFFTPDAWVLRGDLLFFTCSYTIWVNPRRPTSNLVFLGFVPFFQRLFITSIHHHHTRTYSQYTAFGAIKVYEERSTKTQFFKCSPDG